MRLIPLISQNNTDLPGRFYWIILSRIITYGFLFAASMLFLNTNAVLYKILIVYGILAIALLTYLFFTKARSNERLVKAVIGIQLIFEFAIESILINHVGGNFSPLIVLFLLSIVSATLVYGLPGTMLAATIAGFLYSAPIIYDFSKIMPGILESNQLSRMGFSSDEAFYTIFLHLCMFYLIAFISGYVAENQILASRQLRKIKLETDEILENMSSGMVTVDSYGRVIYFNKTAGNILNINHKLAKGASFKSIFLKKFPELFYKIELAMSSGYTESRGEISINVDDDRIPLGISTSVLKGEKNKIRGVIAVFQNLTEAKQMEKRLRDADRLATVGKLSAGIAHEIRNPLASISGSVEVLKNSLELDDVQDKKLLDLILKESSRLNEILTEFLNFARIRSNTDINTEIGPVIDEVIVLANSHPDYKENIEFEYIGSKERVISRGSPEMYKQLLWNLILNSCQAMKQKGGKITIRCKCIVEKNGKYTNMLSISDSGPGIPPNIREKIFDPFYSTKTDGTGLGLAIVKRIVESLEGKIEFDTDKSGTTFDIYLPGSSYPDENKKLSKEIESV